jgi:hypothetical protein
MFVRELKCLLESNPEMQVVIALDRAMVPPNFHVTEVGRVTKKFVDCGGTGRESEACVLQIWVADDFDHRLKTSKLLKIIEAGKDFLSDDLPVEVEFGDGVMVTYGVDKFFVAGGMVCLEGTGKKTACLAPDKCGVTPKKKCCGGKKSCGG